MKYKLEVSLKLIDLDHTTQWIHSVINSIDVLRVEKISVNVFHLLGKYLFNFFRLIKFLRHKVQLKYIKINVGVRV